MMKSNLFPFYIEQLIERGRFSVLYKIYREGVDDENQNTLIIDEKYPFFMV